MFELASAAELSSKLEVVLGSEAYYLDDVVIFSRKLRDVGSLPTAGRSMRGEEPEQNWSVAFDGVGEGCNLSAGHIEHLDVEDRRTRVQPGDVRFGCLDDRRRCWVGCHVAPTTCGEENGKARSYEEPTDCTGL